MNFSGGSFFIGNHYANVKMCMVSIKKPLCDFAYILFYFVMSANNDVFCHGWMVKSCSKRCFFRHFRIFHANITQSARKIYNGIGKFNKHLQFAHLHTIPKWTNFTAQTFNVIIILFKIDERYFNPIFSSIHTPISHSTY